MVQDDGRSGLARRKRLNVEFQGCSKKTSGDELGSRKIINDKTNGESPIGWMFQRLPVLVLRWDDRYRHDRLWRQFWRCGTSG